MRVSDTMMSEISQRGLDDRREELFDAQKVASSGMRVEKPSDDPVAASLARRTRSQERRSESLSKIGGAALDRLEAVDGTLAQLNDVLANVKQLVVQGASDHLSPEDRVALATEAASLREQVLSISNTQIEGEYVFGGMTVDSPPFDAAGTYGGAPNLVEVDVGRDVRLATQVSGAEIFGTAPGAVNAFDTLTALEAALAANDGDAVHALMSDADQMIEQASQGRTNAGTAQQALRQAIAAAQRTRDHAQISRANLTEADPVDAFTQLVKAEEALREAVAIASRLPPPSMLDQ